MCERNDFYEIYFNMGKIRDAWFKNTLDHVQSMIGAIEIHDPEHKDLKLYEAQNELINAYVKLSRAEEILKESH